MSWDDTGAVGIEWNDTVSQVAKVVLTACKDNGRWIRVAVDGRDASGKTTFANHLAKALSESDVQPSGADLTVFSKQRARRWRRTR